MAHHNVIVSARFSETNVFVAPFWKKPQLMPINSINMN